MHIDLSEMKEPALHIRIKALEAGERIARTVPLHDMAALDPGMAKTWNDVLGEAYIVCELNEAGELVGLDITL